MLKKRSDGDVTETAPLPQEKKTRKQSQESVIVYITILFTVVFLLILLSYFMHQRESINTINSLTEEHSEYQIQAQQNIAGLREINGLLSEELEEVKGERDALEARLTEAEKNAADRESALNSEKTNLQSELTKAGESAKLQARRYEALEKYARLMEAARAGDPEAAAQAAESLEAVKADLDEEFAASYEAYLESLKEQEEENEEGEEQTP